MSHEFELKVMSRRRIPKKGKLVIFISFGEKKVTINKNSKETKFDV